ncbi:unnamed protein product [Cladocopium goreaui]|uniref:Cytochrome c domain-containing protein n=1 Tax=Cladocopium goreaui TaxID=2562237 RepID=A0A9P1CSG9_9DINO|nr:unnamed protein product [Cladocopium goreaui]
MAATPPPPPPRPPPELVAEIPFNVRRGQAIFKKYCSQCHTFKTEGRGTIRGPNLFGVVGSNSGSKVKEWGGSFQRLEEFRVIWSKETLLLWLRRPADVVPQKRQDRSCMTFRGMDHEEDCADLVAFLANSQGC